MAAAVLCCSEGRERLRLVLLFLSFQRVSGSSACMSFTESVKLAPGWDRCSRVVACFFSFFFIGEMDRQTRQDQTHTRPSMAWVTWWIMSPVSTCSLMLMLFPSCLSLSLPPSRCLGCCCCGCCNCGVDGWRVAGMVIVQSIDRSSSRLNATQHNTTPIHHNTAAHR